VESSLIPVMGGGAGKSLVSNALAIPRSSNVDHMDSSITIRFPEIGISEEREKTYESEVSDEALMGEVCLGSREALAILFRRYARLVRGVALRVLKDASEAFGCTSSKAIPSMRLRRCSVRPRAMSGTIPSAGWNGYESRFLIANCRAREQYDTRFVQARSRGVVSKRTP